jgi:predicted RNA binding protein YcfA (HicA-like mRNA interferase family)
MILFKTRLVTEEVRDAVWKGSDMPPKIRQLKAKLSKAGFTKRPAKGSHTYWTHPALPGTEVTLSGKDGNDAKPYQIKDVENAIRQLGEKR